jgi:hypothetical protein
MTRVLLAAGVLLAIGCAEPPATIAQSAASSVHPDPPGCMSCPLPVRVFDEASQREIFVLEPPLDPDKLADDLGDPALAPRLAQRIAAARDALARAESADEAQAIVDGLMARIDKIAQEL